MPNEGAFISGSRIVDPVYSNAQFATLRAEYHHELCNGVLRIANGVPSIADSSSRTSKRIATDLFQRLQVAEADSKLKGQIAGRLFESATAEFIRAAFSQLHHLRPGVWTVQKVGEQDGSDEPESTVRSPSAKPIADIAQFQQYAHLEVLRNVADAHPELKASLGGDYIIKPDIVVFREPVTDEVINQRAFLVDDGVALLTGLRSRVSSERLLHASVSCKLTIRSDRAQNSRSEALNLIRNRRGHLPHVAVVTAEPMPSRISSIAMGTGDIDCVYHFALNELLESVRSLGFGDAEDSLNIMISGKRLRDIADLPLDLAV